jgi:tRNA(Leu) C34 or U34 (ribose-2'-O)-methylase TrmL
MKPLNKEILSLAIPSILANITVPLVGMADIAVAGHLGGGTGAAALIGGITIGTMLFDLLYWNFAFLRSGTGGLTAQAYGRLLAGSDGVDQVHGILLRALKIALLSGVVLIALQWVVLWLAFLLVDCTPEVRELASEYFKIRIWAAPATLSLFAFKGWFIGLQDTVRPMIADLIVNGLNIALSFGLGFGLCGLSAMGFAGVLCIKGTADPWQPKVVRAAAGSLLRLPILLCEDAQQALDLLAGAGKQVFTAAMDAELSCWDAPLAENAAIVIGNEGAGAGEQLKAAATLVSIPMAGRTESLNAAVAGSMLMYESYRQKGQKL